MHGGPTSRLSRVLDRDFRDFRDFNRDSRVDLDNPLPQGFPSILAPTHVYPWYLGCGAAKSDLGKKLLFFALISPKMPKNG